MQVLNYRCEFLLNEFAHGIRQSSDAEVKIPTINIFILIRGVYHMHQRQLELKQTTKNETIFQQLYFDSASIEIPLGFDLKFFELMMGDFGGYSSNKERGKDEYSDFMQCDRFGYPKGHRGSYRRSAKLFLMLLDELSRDPDLREGLNVFNICEYFCKRKAIETLVESKFFMFLTVCSDIITNEINIGEIDIDELNFFIIY